MKTYAGQALAVIMIVLVVASILGLSIYSRTVRDTRRIAFEKSSAESFEISESLVETLRGVTMDELEVVCGDTRFGSGLRSAEGCRVMGITDVNEFLSKLDLSYNVDQLGKCVGDNSTVEIIAKISSENDEIEISQNSSRAFILKGQVPNPASCNMVLNFDTKGRNTVGVGVMRKYIEYVRGGDNALVKKYKAYALDDLRQYCVHTTAGNCSSDTSLLGTWTPLQSSSNLTISLAPVSSINYVEEIRITPFNGSIGVRASVSPEQCVRDWEMVKLVINTNCSGASRGVEIQFPQNDWSLPIFDYVIYNGRGALGDN
jgi:hypothetical protein